MKQFLVGFVLLCAASAAAQVPLAYRPLIQESDMVYECAWRLPSGTSTSDASSAIAFVDAATDHLLIAGPAANGTVAKITPPATCPASSTVAGLNAGTLDIAFTDIWNGLRPTFTQGISNGIYPKGIVQWEDKILHNWYHYYTDSATVAYGQILQPTTTLTDTASNTLRSFTLDTSVYTRPRNGTATIQAFYNGYMSIIPPDYRDWIAGGREIITGNCCLPILGRTSNGISIATIDADDNSASTVAVHPLVWYSLFAVSAAPQGSGTVPRCTMGDQRSLAVNGSPNGDDCDGVVYAYTTMGNFNQGCEGFSTFNINGCGGFNAVTSVHNCFIVDGSRSLLCVGVQGLGNTCYGSSTECNDPTTPTFQGFHGYPLATTIWAYDLLHIQESYNGTRMPWNVLPYAVWRFAPQFQEGANRINAAAYDYVNNRMYVKPTGITGGPIIWQYKFLVPCVPGSAC
jgi:hypothetical protein